MFKGLIDDAKSAAASFIDTYLARASVAVPFLIALGLATVALGLELTARFGARNALWMLAGGFCAIGVLAFVAVTMKEQQEMAAEEEQQGNESGLGEMTSAAATQAATQLPSWLLGALVSNPTTTAVAVARLVGRNMPLALLLLLVALMLWPTEEAEDSRGQDDAVTPEPGAQGTAPEGEPLQEAA